MRSSRITPASARPRSPGRWRARSLSVRARAVHLRSASGRRCRHQCLRPARAAIRVRPGCDQCGGSVTEPARGAGSADGLPRGTFHVRNDFGERVDGSPAPPAGDRERRSLCARRPRPRRRAVRADRERRPRLRPSSACTPLLGCVGTFGSRMRREPRLQPCATPRVLAASRCETRSGCRRWLAGRRWGSGRRARGSRASRCSAWGRGSRGQARRARRRWGR